MRYLVHFSALFATLSACGAADALSPDPKNPAHCVAAFHYGRELMLTGNSPNYKVAIGTTGRALYERKQMAAGEVPAGENVGADLLSKYGKNVEVMQNLLLECRTKQNSDPSFQAADKSGEIMAAARKIDPICKSDKDCLSGKKY